MLGKTQIKLVVLMSVIGVVVSCLVTNCPRGGKRGDSEFDSDSRSDVKRCKFCDSDKEICSGGFCSLESCGDEGRCVAPEVCCSKRFCKLERSCRGKFKFTNQRNDVKPSSIILTKILTYNLEQWNKLLRSSED